MKKIAVPTTSATTHTAGPRDAFLNSLKSVEVGERVPYEGNIPYFKLSDTSFLERPDSHKRIIWSFNPFNDQTSKIELTEAEASALKNLL